MLREGCARFKFLLLRIHVCLITITATLTQDKHPYVESENESPTSIWFGLGCCHHAAAHKCQTACVQAVSLSYLYPFCPQEEEDILYKCFYKLDEGLQCCQMSRSPDCLEACSSLFYNDSVPISLEKKRGVYLHCDGPNQDVISCLQNITEWQEGTPEVPAQNLHCCDKSTGKKCRLACKVILKSAMAGEDIVSSLENSGCGPPTHHDELWQCFLLSSVANWKTSSTSTGVGGGGGGGGGIPYARNSPHQNSELDFLGMDSGKLQCCFRAKSPLCLNLCVKTFTNEQTLAWNEFDKSCQYNFVESSMLQCLAEVDEPCRMGCEGLSFCTTFNGRQLEYFRGCTTEADQAAKHDLNKWMKEGVLRLPMIDIPVLNVSTCHPETWKIIACLLYVKPCRQRVHFNQICKTDCVHLLSRCTDTKRLSDEYTPEKLCELLSPPGSDFPCIPISDYLSSSVTSSLESRGMRVPCLSGSCSHHELCLINRECNASLADKRLCTTHTCSAGCRLGESSNLVVAQNAYVAIRHSLQGSRCHSLCQCTAKGTLADCQPVPCAPPIFCNFNGTKIEHNTHFAVDCNICYCYAGETTCTRTFCSTDLIKRNNGGDRLCYCPNHFVPVCAVNGKTYPSACLAKCMGFTDSQFDYEACYYIDPCEPNPCSHGQRCIRKRRVCLTTKYIFCQQYECVGRTNCSAVAQSPVCSSNNVEYPNSCWMLKDNNTLSYHGPCMRECKKTGSVCGINGEQYNNECDVLADFTAVDYIGGCRAFHSYEEQCDGVLCKEISPNCVPIKPFGACCHLCGGGIIQLAYSTKMLEYFLQTLRKMEAASVQSLAASLRRHLSVSECDLFAHLTINKQISVVVIAKGENPSETLVKACALEAERFKKLLTLRSPTFVSEMPLATVIGAVNQRHRVTSGSANLLFISSRVVYGIAIIVIIPMKIKL